MPNEVSASTRRGGALRLLAFAVLAAIVVGILMPRWFSRAVIFPGAPARVVRPGGPVSLVDYRTADGLTLTGIMMRAAQAEADTVVYFHGNAEAAADNLAVAETLARGGYHTFLVEYRGYAGMPGRPSEAGLYLDPEGALTQLAVPDAKLVLVGRSLGSGVAVELARRGRGRALILISPFTSMVDMARATVGPLARWVVTDSFDNASKIAAVRVPVAVLHGVRDGLVPFSMGETLARLVGHARLIPLPDCGHNDIPDVGGKIHDALAAL